MLINIITLLETGLESSMGFFGLINGHTDEGDDEAGLTCMISNSRIPDDYEPGRFHMFGLGMHTTLDPKSISIFCGLGKHGGTPPIAPEGSEVMEDATRLMVVLYCPKAALSPSGSSIPFASLPNGVPLLLGPEVTNPLCDSFILALVFQFIYSYDSGARETEFTGHCVWSHDAHVIMEEKSQLNLMSMGLFQTCSYITEQMQPNVKIDMNAFLQAFSIEKDDGSCIRPRYLSWTDEPASTSTRILNMDDYRAARQAEAIKWIDLQERRSSIIPRLQPTTEEEYKDRRDAVTSDSGPLRRKVRKARKQPGTDIYLHQDPAFLYVLSLLQQ